ncbi:MAG: D-tyrosyl-tRNA(Tyr) deacylase [Oceanospirillaceae bacterium]|jgi:D-aminoacyl-tRNA deacylase|nr:D-tyrosyl-tRNA(Tyr) deacylase [Oceanospirillaceae bacterium]MBT4442250.1 D-tyrosyl-tRNA(Tyr) deacylase [Oceanospirillaceae bacterium]
MKALLQRVTHARVEVDGQCIGQIEHGIMLLLGVDKGDDQAKADQLLHKVLHYRFFGDDDGKMNNNVQQAGGSILIVSQFTLAADTKKGLRPGFSSAAPPALGKQLYDYFVAQANAKVTVATGQFGADMQVSLTNDGPVTFMLEV